MNVSNYLIKRFFVTSDLDIWTIQLIFEILGAFDHSTTSWQFYPDISNGSKVIVLNTQAITENITFATPSLRHID